MIAATAVLVVSIIFLVSMIVLACKNKGTYFGMTDEEWELKANEWERIKAEYKEKE